MRSALLLTFACRLLLRETGSALYLERAVITGVLKHRLPFNMDNFVDDRIEKIATVEDQGQRPCVTLGPFFEPNDDIKVEMVNRFVEQQQIGMANQRLGKVKVYTPAAGKTADWPLQLLIAKSQIVQQTGSVRADGPSVDGVQLTVNHGDDMTIIALICLLERGFQLAVFTITINNMADSRLG